MLQFTRSVYKSVDETSNSLRQHTYTTVNLTRRRSLVLLLVLLIALTVKVHYIGEEGFRGEGGEGGGRYVTLV